MVYRILKDNVQSFFSNRARLAVLVLFLAMIALLARLFYLQLFQYDEMSRLADNNRVRQVRVRADRGFIKDRNGMLLVKNTPGYELEVIKEDVYNRDLPKFLDKLAPIVRFNKDAVLRGATRSYMYEPVKLTRGVSLEQISFLMEHSEDFAGLQYVVDPMRSYEDGFILSHVIGYLGEVNEQEVEKLSGYYQGDMIGRSGAEREYESVLRGKDGSRRVEVDTYGRVYETLSEEPPTHGQNLILTVDYNLQKFASELMQDKVGSIVVLDGEDNSILSMVSAPSYDLNMFNPFINEENWRKLMSDPNKPLMNKPIEGAYPPGSVFKTLIATAALAEGLITEDTVFYCPGWYKATPRTTIIHHCWREGGHGEVNFRQALSTSCDVYFYHLGSLLGIDILHKYANLFGLGILTQVDLPNEKTGLFPSREWKLADRGEPWYPGETTNISIGQGYTTTTPLQIGVMTSSIFNGGKFYAPHIADFVEDPISGERTKIEATLINETPISEEIRTALMAGLVSAVEDRGGTSWRGRVPGLSYGGKTGTAQVVSLKYVEDMEEDEIPEHWRDHSWYVGIYPEKNPRYTVVVMIEHGGSGGRSSAPVASSLISKMLELGYTGYGDEAAE